jgi:hypothetical protein
VYNLRCEEAKMKKKKKTEEQEFQNKTKITRKEAITRLGLTTLSAATMMLLLNEPAKGQDNPDSPDIPPM